MTEPIPLPPDDHELEQFLSRRSDLSQRYRTDAAGEGAPPEMDALVLAQARAELQRPPLRSRRFLRWGRPLAVAATLVLVVSLGWMAQQKPLPQQVAFAPAPPPPDAKAEEVKKQTIAGQAPAGAVQQAQEPARGVNQPSPPAKEPVQQYDRVASAAPPSPSPPPPPAAAIRQATAPAALAKPAAPESRERIFAQRREAPPQESAKGFVAEASAPAAALTAKAAAAPVPFAPAPTPLGMTTPVTVAPAASLAAAPNPCAALPSRVAAQDQVQAGSSADAAAWLEQIRRLRDAEDLKGARAELACFSYLHTAGEVPDDLKALLPGAP